jgi:uncharacterized protein (DUF885 family)
MRRVPLAFALTFGFLATALHVRPASVAEQQPIIIAQVATPQLRSDSRTVDDFFQDFTAEWVRTNPDLARRTRYLAGEEQDRLERQLTPWTEAWRRGRIALARSGLAELQSLDRASMSDAQRLSANVMHWQLQTIIDGEPYYDDSFPLEQFQGANVSLVDALVVVHPVRTARDAENYVAALGQVAERMEEATAEARRRAANGVAARFHPSSNHRADARVYHPCAGAEPVRCYVRAKNSRHLRPIGPTARTVANASRADCAVRDLPCLAEGNRFARIAVAACHG